MKVNQTDIKVFDNLPAGWFEAADIKGVRGFANRMARMKSLGLIVQDGDKFKQADVDMMCCSCFTAGLESGLVNGRKTHGGLGTKQVCPSCGGETYWRLDNANTGGES